MIDHDISGDSEVYYTCKLSLSGAHVKIEGITYSQVQNVVRIIPVNKLPEAYQFLLKLSRETTETMSYQDEFMALPLTEQHRLMEKQAA